MPCTDFENLLIDYRELAPVDRCRADVHLQACAECRNWFEALAEVDAALTARFEGLHAPATLAAALQRKVAQSGPLRVSAVPDILDFAGGLGVICATTVLACFYIPSSLLSAPILVACSSILLAAAVSAAAWSLRGNEN